MSEPIYAIDVAKLELGRITCELRHLINEWESRTGLQLTDIRLGRTDITPNSSSETSTLLTVKCEARIVGESK